MGHIIILPEYDQTPALYIKGLGHPPGTGSSRNVHGRAIDVDSARNVAIAGFRNPVAGAFPRYGMVAYYDKDYNLQWVKSYNPAGAGDCTQYGCTFDSAGNIYTTGVRPGAGEASFIKLDSTGAVLSQRRLKSPSGNNEGRGIAVDPSTGHIYVAIESTGDRCVIIKLNGSTFATMWARSLFQGNSGACTDVAVGVDGTIFACGNSYDGIAGTSRAAAWVARLDDSGSLMWARGLGTTGNHQYAEGIAVDSNNDPIVVGYHDIPTEAPFAAKWNTVGDLQWQRFVTAGSSSRFFGIAIDSDDNAWCSGQTLSGNDNMIHVKLDGSDGTSLVQRRFGGPGTGDDVGYGSAVDNKDAAYIAGNTGIATPITGLETNCEHLLWGKFDGDGGDGTVSWNSGEVTYTGIGLTNSAGTLNHYTNPPHTIASISPTNAATSDSIFTTFLLTDVTPVQD